MMPLLSAGVSSAATHSIGATHSSQLLLARSEISPKRDALHKWYGIQRTDHLESYGPRQLRNRDPGPALRDAVPLQPIEQQLHAVACEERHVDWHASTYAITLRNDHLEQRLSLDLG